MKKRNVEIPELNAAFAPMPDSFHRCIETAFEKEQESMKVRSKMTIALAAALVAVLALGVTAFAIARSAILERFYGSETPAQAAQEMLHEGGMCVEENGVRLELTEYLYDAQAKKIYLTVRAQSTTENGALVSIAEPEFGEGVVATSDFTYIASPMGGGMTMLGGTVEGEALLAETEFVFDYTFAQQPPEDVTLTLSAGVYDSVNAPIWAGPEGEDELYRQYFENRQTALCGNASEGNFAEFASYADYDGKIGRTGGRSFDMAYEAAVTNGFVEKRGEVTLTAQLELDGAAGTQEATEMTDVSGESRLAMTVLDYEYYAPKRELTLYLHARSASDAPVAWGLKQLSMEGQGLLMDDPATTRYNWGLHRAPAYGFTMMLGEGQIGRYEMTQERSYMVRVYLPDMVKGGDALTLRLEGMSATAIADAKAPVTTNPHASVYHGVENQKRPEEIEHVMQRYAENGAVEGVRDEAFEWTFTVPQEGEAHYGDYQTAEFEEYTAIIRKNGAGVLSGEMEFDVYLKRELQESGESEFVNADTTDPLYRWYIVRGAQGEELEEPNASFTMYTNGLGENYIGYSYTLNAEILAQESILLVPCAGNPIEPGEILWDEQIEVPLK